MTRSRRLLAALVAGAIITLPISTATAQETPANEEYHSDQPTRFAEAPGGPLIDTTVTVPITDVGATSTQSREDCLDEVRSARASGTTRTSACVSVDLKTTPDALTAAQQKELAAAISSACSQNTTVGVWYLSSRRDACTHTEYGIVVTEVPSGRVLGTATMHALIDMTASGASWTVPLYTWIWSVTGIGRPELITGNLFGCAGCAGTSSFSQEGVDAWRGTGTFNKTGLATGQVQNNLTGRWQLNLSSTKWTNSVLINLNLLPYRCDNATPGRAAGCVFTQMPAVAGFSQTALPHFTAHVYGAQLSGLPGRLNSGTFLTRLTDQTLRDQNGAKACPSSLPRPTGYQCDEYPFRSTYQGASTSGASAARSLPWCGMPDPERTGPTGWSRCFIPSSQNLSAGGLLSSFYGNQRIIDGDQFQVGYLP